MGVRGLQRPAPFVRENLRHWGQEGHKRESLEKERQMTLTGQLNGFSGLEVACWPLVAKFAVSNPAEAVGFFRAKKSSSRLPSEGK